MQDIILFGIGDRAEKFYYQHRNSVQILYCVSNFITAEEKLTFHGIAVKEAHPENLKQQFIVVASTFYEEIAKQLREYGLKEFEDFCESAFWQKK